MLLKILFRTKVQKFFYANIGHKVQRYLTLAERVCKIAGEGKNNFRYLYNDKNSLFEKIETIAKKIYRADELLQTQL